MPPTETPEEKKKREEDEAAAEAAAEADAKLNGAVKNHVERALKKAMAELTKSVTEQISQAVAGLKQPAPVDDDKSKQGKSGEKVDPETAKLRERLEKLERDKAEADQKLAANEAKQRDIAWRAAVREALEAEGVKGARARAVIADLEAQGAKRFTDDGEPLIAVSRSRSKGAKVEEFEFDNIADGIKDWTKTSDAAEFLPAPGTGKTDTKTTPRAALGRSDDGTKKAPRRYETAAQSEDEMARRTAEQLESEGIDINRAFR